MTMKHWLEAKCGDMELIHILKGLKVFKCLPSYFFSLLTKKHVLFHRRNDLDHESISVLQDHS